MTALLFRTALVVAAVVPLWAAPAHAQSIPAEPATVYLKDHLDIPLGWSDTGARLTAEHDLWTFRSVEALIDVGTYLIRHEDTGQCLTADTSSGAEAVPLALADCDEALAWQAVFNDVPSHSDYRFVTPDGYHLGLEDGDDAVEGAEVFAVLPESGASRHFHEWNLAITGAPLPPRESPSPSPSPSESPSDAASTSPAAQPQLPVTGGAMGAVVGAAAVAIAGGTALVLWWQRRRALRSHW